MKRDHRRLGRWTIGAATLVLAAGIILSGCGAGENGAGQEQDGSANTNAAADRTEAEKTEQGREDAGEGAEPAEQSEPETGRDAYSGTGTKALLPNVIVPYDGAEEIAELDGEPYKAVFMKDPMRPYGFYIPEEEGVRKEDFEDGSEWWMGERSIFSLFDDGQVVPDYNFTNPELADYAEYVGSVNDREVIYEDFFAFEDRGSKWIVRFSYRAEEAAEVLPVFLDMLKSIRYVEGE